MNRFDIGAMIDAEEVEIGAGVVFERGVQIRAKRVRIGDHVYIGEGVKVFTPEFCIGHYSKLHEHSIGHGEKPLQIGRNCWIGRDVVLDSTGGLDIDDNVGIGHGSHVYTHIAFGDVVQGCRWNSAKYMHIGRDAWFVGHCLVSPVKVGERAMAMLGSTITRDMEPNHVYGGVPAKDLTDKLGPQFEERNIYRKLEKMYELIRAFERDYPKFAGMIVLEAVAYPDDIAGGATLFNVHSRTYTRRNTEAEIAFLKAHMPKLIKFVPDDEPRFFELQKTLQDDEMPA